MRVSAAVLAVLLGVVVLLGSRTPAPAPAPPAALGPEAGEQVGDYLARAEAGRSGQGARWALVSLEPPLDPAGVAALLPAELRLSQVLLRVPLERVQTPLVTRELADQRSRVKELGAAWTAAAGTLTSTATSTTTTAGRGAQVGAYSARQLGAQCACAVGLVVRADVTRLDALAGSDGVRAVQAAPADVSYGGLSVRPLLPEQVDVVAPGPDDGRVPTG